MNIRTGKVALLLPVLLALLTACGGGSQRVSPTDGPTDHTGPTSARPPAGEIWQWALGRGIDEPELQAYGEYLDEDEANVQSEGFQLFLDATGTVVSVTLFNDESALGFGSTNTFQAYAGELPGGLDWDCRAADITGALGPPDRAYTEGWGVEHSFTYTDWEGYGLEIRMAGRHSEDLETSPMHSITVSRP